MSFCLGSNYHPHDREHPSARPTRQEVYMPVAEHNHYFGSSSYPHRTYISTNKISLAPVGNPASGDLAEKIYYQCAYCEKLVGMNPFTRDICEKLSGGDEFYCSFCIRNGFNTRRTKHILTLSFRAILGYYYYELFAYSAIRKMWFSEIEDFLRYHIWTGGQNPIFTYDYDTMLWFVDFSKVGRSRRKIKVTEIIKTITNILACFNLRTTVPKCEMHEVYRKYAEAVMKFYTQRYRPEGRPMLIPTLQGCGDIEVNKRYNIDTTRYFSLPSMVNLT